MTNKSILAEIEPLPEIGRRRERDNICAVIVKQFLLADRFVSLLIYLRFFIVSPCLNNTYFCSHVSLRKPIEK